MNIEKQEIEKSWKKDLFKIFELLEEFTEKGLNQFEIKYKLWKIEKLENEK